MVDVYRYFPSYCTSLTMTSLPVSERKAVLGDVREALDIWIPRRKAAVLAMVTAADEIAAVGKSANTVKLVGSIVGAVGGLIAGTLGVVAIVATGGLGTLFVVAGVVAGLAGVGGAATTCLAEIRKAIQLLKLLKEVPEHKIDEEIDDYKTVIHNLERLHRIIKEKGKVKIPSQTWSRVSIGVAAGNVVVNLLMAYSFLSIHVAEVASNAAAHAATAAAIETTLLGLMGPSTEAVILSATRAAEMAAASTIVGALLKGISKNTTIAIAETAGKAAGEAAIEAIGKSATKEGARLAAEAAALPAARAAGRVVLKDSVKATGKTMGEVAAIAAGETTGIAGKTTGKSAVAVLDQVLGKSLPLLSFGFAVWDIYMEMEADWDLKHGTKEEIALRAKIKELKEEANKVVDKIYNFFVDDEMLTLDPMPVPFPDLVCTEPNNAE